MSKFQKYPVFQYDEPAIYNDFKGGLNTDPSSENLLDNEIRDVTNMDYINNTLSKRMGAKKFLELKINEDLSHCQGLWIFSTSTSTYIVLAHRGKLHYSLYDPVLGTNFIPLKINITQENIYNLTVRSSEINNLTKHDGYVLQEEENYSLIFQNKHKIEAATTQNCLYIATGTRIVKVYEENYELNAEVLKPYRPTGIESTKIGLNYLHPYPLKHIETTNLNASYTGIHGIIQDGNTLSAVMSYAPGESKNNYKFQWKVYDEETDSWELKTMFSQENSVGASSYEFSDLINEEGKSYRVAVTFAKSFAKEEDVTGEEPEITYVIENGDWVPNKIDGSWWGGSELTTSPQEPEYNKRWLAISSCKKVLSDGDKLLYYDDDYNSGEIFKTIINNPEYITLKGGLTFKTTKNERVVKIIHFKGVLVVFSNSNHAGGNIAIITGNGDDFAAEGDTSYSPYVKRFVNTSVGCDNPYTVQVADNLLIFKYMDKVYFIEGSQLNSEIVEVQTLNDRIKHSNGYVKIPWDDNSCVSEITNEFYALIWKEKAYIENKEKIIERPAMRIKMYYKNGYMLDNKVYFPWLKDEGTTFNVDTVFQLGGVSTHLYNNNLIQYTDELGQDLKEDFKYSIRLRAVDLGYPKITKLLKSVILYYYKDIYEAEIKVEAKNESGNIILSQSSREAPSSVDKPSIQYNEVLTNNHKIGRTMQEARIFKPNYRFPCLLVDLYIEGKNKGLFSLSSVTFDYITTNIPQKTTLDSYKQIITEDTIQHLSAKSSKQKTKTSSQKTTTPDTVPADTPSVSGFYVIEKNEKPTYLDKNHPLGTLWIFIKEEVREAYLLIQNTPSAVWIKLMDDSLGTSSNMLKNMSGTLTSLQQEVTELKDGKPKEKHFSNSELLNQTLAEGKPKYMLNLNNSKNIRVLEVLRKDIEDGLPTYNKVTYDIKELNNKKVLIFFQEPIDGKVIYIEV